MAPLSKGRSHGRPAEREVVSEDGQLGFFMKRTTGGVHVERSHRLGACCEAHVVLFATPHEFGRFFDNDELRFDYPLLYQQIRRSFDDLFELDS